MKATHFFGDIMGISNINHLSEHGENLHFPIILPGFTANNDVQQLKLATSSWILQVSLGLGTPIFAGFSRFRKSGKVIVGNMMTIPWNWGPSLFSDKLMWMCPGSKGFGIFSHIHSIHISTSLISDWRQRSLLQPSRRVNPVGQI